MVLSRKAADTGASIVEYAGLIVLAALIVGALVALGLPGRVADGVRDALCQVFEQRRCPVPDAKQKPALRNPYKPASCLRNQSLAATDHNFKVIAYRRNHNKTTMTQRNSDGSINETTSGTGGNGVDLGGSFGGKVKADKYGVDLSAGFDVLATSAHSTQLSFKGNRRLGLTPDQQRSRYHSTVLQRRRQLTNELAEDPDRSSDPDFRRRWNEVPTDTARELGVHTSVFVGGGEDVKIKASGSLDLAGVEGAVEGDQVDGASIDDNGTADRRDDITTVKFTHTAKVSGSGGITASPFPEGKWGAQLPRAKGNLSGEYSPVTSYQVKFRGGKPTQLVMTRQVITSAGAGFNYGLGGKHGQGGQNDGQMIGTVSSQNVTVDLTQHPEVYASLRDYLNKSREDPSRHPTGRGKDADKMAHDEAVSKAAARLNNQAGSYGQLSQVDYDRKVRTTGPSGSVSWWVELAAGEWTETNDNWTAKDARYFDRGQGKWVSWPECVQGVS